jgi:hypothetical protein
MNKTARIRRAQESLAQAIRAFDEVLKDCTPEELLGARTNVEILADAERRMEVLANRMTHRPPGSGG